MCSFWYVPDATHNSFSRNAHYTNTNLKPRGLNTSIAVIVTQTNKYGTSMVRVLVFRVKVIFCTSAYRFVMLHVHTNWNGLATHFVSPAGVIPHGGNGPREVYEGGFRVRFAIIQRFQALHKISNYFDTIGIF